MHTHSSPALLPSRQGVSASRDLCRGQRPLFTSPISQEPRKLRVKQAHSPPLSDNQQATFYMWDEDKYKQIQVLHMP